MATWASDACLVGGEARGRARWGCAASESIRARRSDVRRRRRHSASPVPVVTGISGKCSDSGLTVVTADRFDARVRRPVSPRRCAMNESVAGRAASPRRRRRSSKPEVGGADRDAVARSASPATPAAPATPRPGRPPARCAASSRAASSRWAVRGAHAVSADARRLQRRQQGERASRQGAASSANRNTRRSKSSGTTRTSAAIDGGRRRRRRAPGRRAA